MAASEASERATTGSARCAVLGAVSGALSGAAVLIPLGATPAELFGTCVGIRVLDDCSGLDLSVYLFPGLIFGLVFALAWRRAGLLSPRCAALLALAAALSNAVAVAAALPAFGSHDDFYRWLAAGAIGGTVGGGLLGRAAGSILRRAGWPRLLVAGATLGLLLPLWQLEPGWPLGEILFYVLWQGGYAAVLGWQLSTQPDVSLIGAAPHEPL